MKLHLESDIGGRGVIVNREVEVRRQPGSNLGDRTDIHVDAIAPSPRPEQFDRVTVIVEVKGCWNRELDSAMGKQLRDKYMRESSCEHGLYLVAWFNCDKWDPEDTRARPGMTVDEALIHFSRQAESTSSGGIIIGAYVLDVHLP